MLERLAIASILAFAAALPKAAGADTLVPWESLLEPGDRATNVPTNALVWIGSGHLFGTRYSCVCTQDRQPKPLAVLTPQGDHVPGRIHHIRNRGCGSQDIFVFIPDRTFDPSTRYRIAIGAAELSSFETGTGPKLDTPARARVRSQASGPSVVAFDLEPAGYTVAIVEQAQAAKDLNQVSELTEIADTACDACSNFEPLYVGTRPCGENTPQASSSGGVSVVFGGFDVAGRFSGWSEPVHADFEAEPGCGCTTAADATPASTLALGLLVLWARVRKRTRRQ